jgi:hypothetical protein
MPRGKTLCTLLVVALSWASAEARESYRSRDLDRSLSREATVEHLRALQNKVQATARRGARPVVVFDIDDTLVKRAHDGQSKAIHGSVAFVGSLIASGARVVYLSARPEYKRAATTALLARLGFPSSAENLLLNPTRLEGAEWKRNAKPILTRLGTPLAFFDNDYRHVRTFRSQYPESNVFRLNRGSERPDPGGRGLFEVIDRYYSR